MRPRPKNHSPKPDTSKKAVEPAASSGTTKKTRVSQEEGPKPKRGKTTKPEAEVALTKKTKAKCFDPKYIQKPEAKASPKSKTKAKSPSKKAVKQTIDKPRRKGKSKASKSKKAKKAWEAEMLEEEAEEEQPAEDLEIQERPGVAISEDPGSEHEGGDCEAPATPAAAETPDVAETPAVASTQLDESHTEGGSVKEEKQENDSQQSLATLLRGNEQMLAQSLCTILESQAQSPNSQTESQLFAGMLASY